MWPSAFGEQTVSRQGPIVNQHGLRFGRLLNERYGDYLHPIDEHLALYLGRSEKSKLCAPSHGKRLSAPHCSFCSSVAIETAGGVVIATHDIPDQAVIQGSDLEMANASHHEPKRSTVRDRRDVIGHIALHPMHEGEPLDRSDFN